MRKITYGAACSLDGFIARPDDGVDWLRWSIDVQRITAAYWARVDTVLMGRKTYDVARSNGTAPYPSVKNFVFSRTLSSDSAPGVHLVREEAATFIRQLKESDGGEICVMGGGNLAHTLFEADLIDEVGANIHPILLGEGVPLFRAVGKSNTLELISGELIAQGCVYLLYRIVR